MTVVGVIIVLLLLGLGWLLLTSLKLCIDTSERQYYLLVKGLFAARIVPTKDFFVIKLKVPFYTFRFDPLEKRKPSKKPKKKSKSKSITKKNGKSWSATMAFARDLMATFRVKHFVLDLDTGDYILNAQLVPVFTLLSRGPVNLQTNFTGKSYLSLEIENRLIRMVRPAFKYLISK